jgi:hypothetical protein
MRVHVSIFSQSIYFASTTTNDITILNGWNDPLSGTRPTLERPSTTTNATTTAHARTGSSIHSSVTGRAQHTLLRLFSTRQTSRPGASPAPRNSRSVRAAFLRIARLRLLPIPAMLLSLSLACLASPMVDRTTSKLNNEVHNTQPRKKAKPTK